MGPRRRTTALAATVVAISLMVAGGVMAATQSRDEAALQPTRAAADRGIERRVDRLLAQMTLDEKLQQVQLLSDGARSATRTPARAWAGSSAWWTP